MSLLAMAYLIKLFTAFTVAVFSCRPAMDEIRGMALSDDSLGLHSTCKRELRKILGLMKFTSFVVLSSSRLSSPEPHTSASSQPPQLLSVEVLAVVLLLLGSMFFLFCFGARQWRCASQSEIRLSRRRIRQGVGRGWAKPAPVQHTSCRTGE